MATPNRKMLPLDFTKCSKEDLVLLISRMLTSLIAINDSMNQNRTMQLTRFHSRTPPGISVYQYLARLTKYATLDHAVLLATVYYIDLLSNVYPMFSLNSLTVHRFLLTAATVATKGLCDTFCTNSFYAKVGGVHVNELNVLERDFLSRVCYRILPREGNIDQCKMEIKSQREFPSVERSPSPMSPAICTPATRGYSVLSQYYTKIVDLVGQKVENHDPSGISYLLEKSSVCGSATPPLKRPMEVEPEPYKNEQEETVTKRRAKDGSANDN